MNDNERVLVFQCDQETLFGILALPKASLTTDTGVVVIVGGPQYRVGSHRQFVLLSRALARAGYPVLRFDYRGMGDSTGDLRNFLQVTPDVGAAIGAMQRELPQIKRMVLWGLCDGASAALLYCHETNDARVSGLCLLNPWVRSEASLARAHVKHYYAERLMQKEFWLKLLSGKVATTALLSLWRNVNLAFRRSAAAPSTQALPFQHRMAAAWRHFGGNILLLLSGDDYVAKEFLEYSRSDPAWQGLLESAHVVRHDFPGMDHTFSNALARCVVENSTAAWLKSGLGHDELRQL